MYIDSKSYIKYEDYLKEHPELESVKEEAKILQKFEDDFFNLFINHVG